MGLRIKEMNLTLALIGVGVAYLLMTYAQVPGYQYRWSNCVDYLIEGTIYGGQPECVQPPATYLVGALLTPFGADITQIIANALNMGANAFTLWILLSLIKGDSKTKAALILAYCFLVLPQSVEHGLKPGKAFLDTSMALAFVAASTYTFLKRENNTDLMVASVFMVAALSFKMTATSAAAAMFTALAVKAYKKRKHLRESVKPLAAYLLPLATVALVFIIVFPDAPTYLVFAHTDTARTDLPGTLYRIINTNPFQPEAFLFYFLIAAAALYMRKHEDEEGILFAVTLTASYFTMYQLKGTAQDITNIYYVVYPLFYLLVCAGKHVNALDEKTRTQTATVLVLASLFFGGYNIYGKPSAQEYGSLLASGYGPGQIKTMMEARDRAEYLINSVYGLLPNPEKQALMDARMWEILSKYAPQLNKSVLDYESVPQDRVIDSVFALGLLQRDVLEGKIGLDMPEDMDTYNMEKYDHEMMQLYEPTEKEQKTLKILKNGGYDMLIVSPAAWSTHLNVLFQELTEEEKQRYCVVFLPVFKESIGLRHWSTTFIDDPQKCLKTGQSAVKYLSTIFDEVCAIDQDTANFLLKGVTSKNTVIECSAPNQCRKVNADLSRTCNSGRHTISAYMNARDAKDLRVPAIFLTAFAWTIAHKRIRFKLED